MEVHGPNEVALGSFDLNGRLGGVAEAWPIKPKKILYQLSHLTSFGKKLGM